MAILTEEILNEAALRESVRTDPCGAVISFAGVVREENEGRGVSAIDYEAAADVALAAMEKIEQEALAKFEIERIVVAHRIGHLEVGEASVVIAVGAGHRPAAFDACRWAIDTLKERVPIWKKEHFEGGGTGWVAGVKMKVK